MILVTSYPNPDIDGTASAIAYAEFLGETAALSNIPHREASFVLNKLGIKPIKAEGLIGKAKGIILVDTSQLSDIDKRIDPSRVIEIIDHRKVHEAQLFPNAKVQMDLVGATATLIAEKFKDSGKKISESSAKMLYLAICSHTINLKSNVTTQRDRDMVSWLNTKCAIEPGFLKEMWAFKSKFDKPFEEVLDDDLAPFKFGSLDLGVAQLELINLEEFINTNLDALRDALRSIQIAKSFDIVFLTCIDIEKASNMFVVIDEKTERLLEQALGLKFSGGVARREGILMRKEIMPKVKEILE